MHDGWRQEADDDAAAAGAAALGRRRGWRCRQGRLPSACDQNQQASRNQCSLSARSAAREAGSCAALSSPAAAPAGRHAQHRHRHRCVTVLSREPVTRDARHVVEQQRLAQRAAALGEVEQREGGGGRQEA